MPKFSVVISVYNKEKYIGETLNSVLAQTVNDFEIIIVNDGSTDKSESVIQTFQAFEKNKIRYFKQSNQGASAGRNAGIKKVKGNYIAFLDADDLWYPNHLEEINALLQKFPNEAVFSTAIEIEDAKRVRPAKYVGITSERYQLLDFFKSSYAAPILSGSSTVIAKSSIEKIGLFDETIQSGEDTDYWIRLGINYQVGFSTKITAKYRYVADSLSQKKPDFNRKTDFSKFGNAAKNNSSLAKYIAFNRFSLWIDCQMANDVKNAEDLKNKINPAVLLKKQKLLLKMNGTQLRWLLKAKKTLQRFGVRLSAFET